MSWILEYFVVYLCVYVYVRSVTSSYLLFCCIYFVLVLGVSNAVEVLVPCLVVVVYKIPYSSCIYIRSGPAEYPAVPGGGSIIRLCLGRRYVNHLPVAQRINA